MIKKSFLFVLFLSTNLFSATQEKDSILEVKEFISKSSSYIKEQLSLKNVTLDEDKFLQKFSTIGTKEIDRYTPKLSTFKKVDNLLSEVGSYDNIIIEVDSSVNTMFVKAKIDNKIKLLNTYKVSTARKDVQKPLGEGNITSITLNPIWYPTQDTIDSFKKHKGIDLPKKVLGGDKLNYMGSAKINLTHRVNGKETFRIHGTVSEKTIGTYESSGCIRMKNSEVVGLVGLLNEFIDFKSMDDIKVILK